MEDTHNSKEETLAIILKKLEKNEENLNKRLDSLTKEITIAKRENYDHFSNLEKIFQKILGLLLQKRFSEISTRIFYSRLTKN